MTIDEHGMACPDEVEYPDWEGEYRAQCAINSGLRRQVNDLKSQLAEAQKERIHWLDFPANYPAPGKWPVVLRTMQGWFEGFWGTDTEASAEAWKERGVTHWLNLQLPVAMEAKNGRA